MKKGFTLIELLVVVAVIGVLTSIVLSSLNEARASSRDAKRLSDIRAIHNALELYHINNGVYPSPSGGWHHSNSSTWDDLEAALGITLPRDPLNGSGQPYNSPDNYSYSYLASYASSFCVRQAYLLVFNLEGKHGDGQNDGVLMCGGPGDLYNYGNAFVVGINSDGSYTSPDTSGTSK